MAKADTSWGKVADWYDEYLGGDDSYQSAVILPNLMRILDPKAGESVVDLACGQGFFSVEIALRRASVTGVDISPELIAKAEERISKLKKEKNIKAKFIVSSADSIPMIPSASADKIVCVLAAQNIKELDVMFGECARVLKKGGKLVLVLNHPSFRVPQASDWHFAEEKKAVLIPGTLQRTGHVPARQGRVVYQYLSEASIKIDMNPGSPKDKKYTLSYHRPLQVFVKWLSKRKFAITRLEEWMSHKKSKAGPKALIEDTARKEIPMFMCIEATLM